MQFIKTVITRFSVVTPGFAGVTPGLGTPGAAAPAGKIALRLSQVAKRTGFGVLGHRGRQVCRFGRQNSLYGLHCDRDTARIVSVFAKGVVRPVARKNGHLVN